ncbi:MAG: hypothetical protein A2Y73_07520 [Chloroflexi bacterium RBG_13_56_8]|nr:MAG: hypothetical protein A2Y73_07520 [Chloroflexi bacterium RBG_13_56_8]
MPRAVSLAERLLNAYQAGVGEVALIPSHGGAFEVIVGTEKIYSKLETGLFPDERMMVQAVGDKL